MFTESKSGHDEQEEYVSWSLLPMLNWFVENWLPLFSEQKPPEASDGDCAYFMGLNFAQKRLWGGDFLLNGIVNGTSGSNDMR